MASPSYDSVLGYVVDVEAEIHKATAAWQAYGYAASDAYSKAYVHQGEVLKAVSANLEQMRKDEEAMLSLAFTILTVGVAGPLASAFLKGKVDVAVEEVTAAIKDQAVVKTAKAAAEVAKDSLSDSAKKVMEKASDKITESLQSPSREEAFQPSGIPPDQYGDELQEAIQRQTGALEDTVVTFLRKGSAGMTMDGAKRLSQGILNSDFITRAPGAVNKSKLKTSASVALWLAWAWARDVKYWSVHNIPTIPGVGKELAAFEPIRKELVEQLHLPAADINQKAFSVTGKFDIMNMSGLIRWSFSAGARATLFAGMPANPLGRSYAEMQMQQSLLKINLQRMGFVSSDGD